MTTPRNNSLRFWQEEHAWCQKMLGKAIEAGDAEGAKTWQNEIDECQRQIDEINAKNNNAQEE